MIRNIKENLTPKTGMQKISFLQDSGYVKDIKDACCVLQDAIVVLVTVVEDVEDGTNYNIGLFVMLKVSKVLYTYMNRKLTVASLLFNLNWVNV